MTSTATSYNAAGNVLYSYAQLEGIWCQAGGAPAAAPIAAAIAMAESGGNTAATNNDSNGTVDRGLWQINSVHGSQSTYDVMGNARAAIAISNNGSNWSPWTTYTNGAYQQYLQTNVPADMSAPINATNAAANNNATLTSQAPGGPYDPLNWAPDAFGWFGQIFNLPQSAANAVDKSIATAIQGAILSILNPIFNMIAGIAGITAGAAMVLVGIFLMVKNTEAGQEAGKAAGSALQTGLSLAAPETGAETQYVGAVNKKGQQTTTTVTQRRKAAGAVKVGGQRIQYRPARVRTDVSRSTAQVLRDQAGEYTNNREPAQ